MDDKTKRLIEDAWKRLNDTRPLKFFRRGKEVPMVGPDYEMNFGFAKEAFKEGCLAGAKFEGDKTKRLLEAAKNTERSLINEFGNSGYSVNFGELEKALTAFEAESDTPHAEGVMVPRQLIESIEVLREDCVLKGTRLDMFLQKLSALSRGGK